MDGKYPANQQQIIFCGLPKIGPLVKSVSSVTHWDNRRSITSQANEIQLYSNPRLN